MFLLWSNFPGKVAGMRRRDFERDIDRAFDLMERGEIQQEFGACSMNVKTRRICWWDNEPI
jgi:hypothetical protein